MAGNALPFLLLAGGAFLLLGRKNGGKGSGQWSGEVVPPGTPQPDPEAGSAYCDPDKQNCPPGWECLPLMGPFESGDIRQWLGVCVPIQYEDRSGDSYLVGGQHEVSFTYFSEKLYKTDIVFNQESPTDPFPWSVRRYETGRIYTSPWSYRSENTLELTQNGTEATEDEAKAAARQWLENDVKQFLPNFSIHPFASVTKIQDALAALGYLKFNQADGKWEQKSKGAMAEFMAERGYIDYPPVYTAPSESVLTALQNASIGMCSGPLIEAVWDSDYPNGAAAVLGAYRAQCGASGMDRLLEIADYKDPSMAQAIRSLL